MSAVSGSGSTAVSTAAQGLAQETAADYALFLKDKFGIAFGDAPTKGDFIAATAAALRLETGEDAETADGAEAAAAADDAVFDDVPASSVYYAAAAALYREGIISGGTVNPQAPLTAINAAQIAVKAAGLKELAYTYPADKADRTLAPFNLSAALLGLQGAQELAAAIDTGLVPADHYDLIRERGTATAEYAAVLLGKTLESRGAYKRYIGWVSDDNILNELLERISGERHRQGSGTSSHRLLGARGEPRHRLHHPRLAVREQLHRRATITYAHLPTSGTRCSSSPCCAAKASTPRCSTSRARPPSST